MLLHIKNVEKMHAALSMLNVFNDDFFRRMLQSCFSVKRPKMFLLDCKTSLDFPSAQG